jgi:hypothetical protein
MGQLRAARQRPPNLEMMYMMLSIRKLRKRGWCERLIDRYLGAPDETRAHYRGTVRLWREERVIEAEKLPDFFAYRNEHTNRSRAPRENWTDAEVFLLQQMAPTQSEAEIAGRLGRTRGAIAAMKFRLGLEVDAESKSDRMREVRARAGDTWTPEQKAIIEQRGRDTLAKDLLPLINQVGSSRTAAAIRGKRNADGITISGQLRSRIGQYAQSHVDHDSRLTVPVATKWNDLPNIARQVFLGGVLGDGGLYIKTGYGRYYYYAETHGLAQENYLAWKRGLVGEGFRGGFCRVIDRRKDRVAEKPNWQTPSHPIFTELRLQFYADECGDKSIIPELVMEELDEFGLMIWYLDDGSAGVSGGRPYPCISAPGWQRDCLEKLGERINSRLDLRLYVWPRKPRPRTENRIMLDRDRLMPIWRKFVIEYNLPECMLYKIPDYIPAMVGGRLGGKRFGYRTIDHPTGAKTLELDPAQQKLISNIIEMKRNGNTLRQINKYLELNGQPLSTKGISRLLNRLASTLIASVFFVSPWWNPL